MGGFVAGLTKAMGDPTLSDQQAEMRQRRLLLADAYRKNQLDQFQKAQQDIDTLLASKQVMDNGALRPLTPEEITDWTQKRQQVAQHIQNLYNPSFDPGRNMVPEDPIHKLASKIHLAKPRPAGEAKNAAQQKTDLQGILQKATPAPGTELAQKGQIEETQRKQKIDAAVKAMREAGATDDEIKQFQVRASEAAAGVRTSTTQRFYKSPDGKQADWFIPGEQPQGWQAGSPSQMTPKPPKLLFKGNQAFLTVGDHTYSQSDINTAPPELQTLFANAMNAAAAVRHTAGIHPIQVPQKDGTIKLMDVEVESSSGFGPAAPPAGQTKSTKSPGEQKKDLAGFKKKLGGGVVGEGITIGARETSTDRQLSKEYGDTNAAYEAAVDRQDIMHKNAVDAKQKHDQQAMLSLVANHIGMTLGAQKGARINQAVWNEAIESAPWLQAVAAKFDDRGLLSGVTLTDDQIDQMVRLADEKVDTLKKHLARSKAKLPQGTVSSSDMSDDDFLLKVNNAAKPKQPKQ